ncbi:hypothetical protein H9639_14925 [Arthrobacter sp. Sa2CUA1]|uniref:Integral membrane protein n=1 Tax=Arthrobacter gallicola TaxID=2762225 RepID=A0ABR8UVL0_9MICC|nr:hypothetical protein [Arthrobacter gallicola]MBD7996589.1 hypothetical protein [Arthrobacter gallicola]
MEPRLPETGKTPGQTANSAFGSTAPGPGAVPRSRRSAVRRILTVLAAVLAVAGVASLGLLLLQALGGAEIWPGFAAGAFYALPAAFLLMAGLVIGSIVHRRRG